MVRRAFLALSLALISFCLLPSPSARAGAKAELELPAPIARELNQVLKVSSSLHQSLVAQDEEQTELGLRDVIHELQRARKASEQFKPHERGHLLRILDAAQDDFEQTLSSSGTERTEHLEEAFNQLVNLLRIYRLDHAYGIFFCPKDRTNWVQKGDRAKNPFHTEGEREPCGMKVPR
jgi:hypothetical protein